jgi:hypothetical protein
MTCPDPADLLHDEAARKHALSCEDCARILRQLALVREAFAPPVAVDDRLESLALSAVARAKEEDHRRSAAGAAVTFVLAALTLTPLLLHALGAWSATPAAVGPTLLAVVVLAVCATVLEPRVANG